MEQYSDELEELQQKIKGAQQSATQFNMRETILGTPASDYSMLKSINDTFDPFFQFWTTADRYCPFAYAAPHLLPLYIYGDCTSISERNTSLLFIQNCTNVLLLCTSCLVQDASARDLWRSYDGQSTSDRFS